jgi:hypothetical protein
MYVYIPFLFRVSWHSSPTSAAVPDVHAEADFDIPDTQAVLERYMSNMSKLADDEYLSLSVLLDSLPDPSSFSTEMLKTHLPGQVGGAQGWNFEKAHSILHKVREIIMCGWSENTSCQGPEHAHIDIIKSMAHLTNKKDVFLCILRYHCRHGLLQQYEQLLEDMIGQGEVCKLQLD